MNEELWSVATVSFDMELVWLFVSLKNDVQKSSKDNNRLNKDAFAAWFFYSKTR